MHLVWAQKERKVSDDFDSAFNAHDEVWLLYSFVRLVWRWQGRVRQACARVEETSRARYRFFRSC